MLAFFRKYQKGFFLFTTVAIVISFVFFGTYQTTPKSLYSEEVAFYTLDGEVISIADKQKMRTFLRTDAEDQMETGRVWGPNFLNDGVVKKDFLESGLAQMLAEQYFDDIKETYEARLSKEQRFKPYVHPSVKFLSAETVWSYYAPDLRDRLNIYLRTAENDISGFDQRVNLYLAQREFPVAMLRRVLYMQEQQYSWLEPNPNLMHANLGLFTYESLEDWFGPQFLDIVTQFVFNAAALAESKGYVVTKEETLADLQHSSAKAFERFQSHPQIGVRNSDQYMAEQLRRMTIDRATAVKIWQKVLLCRRLFEDAGNAAVVDALAFKKFQDFANESINVNLYQLPRELYLLSFRDLQRLEIYLDSVTKRKNLSRQPEVLLDLPSNFLSVSDVEERESSLVTRRYLLKYAKVDKNQLLEKVGVKEIWDWQVEDSHWAQLQMEFPNLGSSKAKTIEERFSTLLGLDEVTRAEMDAFAGKEIIEGHSEWLQEALDKAPNLTETFYLSLYGQHFPLEGITDRLEFIKLLNIASMTEESGAPDAFDAAQELQAYTGDGDTYYRIVVLDRDDHKQVLTFAEAQEVLDLILDRRLQEHYTYMRSSRPKSLSGNDGEILPFEAVKSRVADSLFKNLVDVIYDDFVQFHPQDTKPEEVSGDAFAAKRLYRYIRKIQEATLDNPLSLANHLRKEPEEAVEGTLHERLLLKDQWKLLHSQVNIQRSNRGPLFHEEVFKMKDNEWSPVFTTSHGDVHFFQRKNSLEEESSLENHVKRGQKILADDARRYLMKGILNRIVQMQAISLKSNAEETANKNEEKVR